MISNEPDYKAELLAWGQERRRLQEAPEELLYAIVNELTRLGLQPGLGSVAIRTAHPQLDMLVMRWRPLDTDEVPTTGTTSITGQQTIKRPDGVMDLYPLAHGHTDEAMWRQSPFNKALETQKSLRVKLEPPPSPPPFPIIDDLIERGMTDYVVFPLDSGPTVSVVVSIATQRPGGFPDVFISAFEDLIPILSLSVAYKVERFQFQQVLTAYIGREPANRVLAGQIRRGDVITRQAAIGFADLRGFTAASQRLDAEEFLALIGTFFEHTCDCVYGERGEVLKFMGDGVLFIIADDGNPTQTCDRALRSVEALTKAIDQHNASTDSLPIRFGCALHYGAVLYGNIGSPARLDFTVVGSAVNLTARLEALTSKVGEICLVSQDFSDLTTMETRHVGEFQLKGLNEPQPAYAPLVTSHP